MQGVLDRKESKVQRRTRGSEGEREIQDHRELKEQREIRVSQEVKEKKDNQGMLD